MSRNAGKTLETLVDMICDDYARTGEAKIHKVDPPTRTFAKGRTMLLPSPFLDYIGTWTEAGGRTIALEAKHTETHRLNVSAGTSTGVTPRQLESLLAWSRAGAATGILWEHRNEMRLVTVWACAAVVAEGQKSIQWAQATRIPRGQGKRAWDFLRAVDDTEIR